MFLKRPHRYNERSIKLFVWLILDEAVKEGRFQRKLPVVKRAVMRHRKRFNRGRPMDERMITANLHFRKLMEDKYISQKGSAFYVTQKGKEFHEDEMDYQEDVERG